MGVPPLLFRKPGALGVLSCWAHRGSLPNPTGTSFLDWAVRLRSARLTPSRRARARRLPQPGAVRLAWGPVRAGSRSSAYCLSCTVLAMLPPYFRPCPAHWFPRSSTPISSLYNPAGYQPLASSVHFFFSLGLRGHSLTQKPSSYDGEGYLWWWERGAGSGPEERQCKLVAKRVDLSQYKSQLGCTSSGWLGTLVGPEFSNQ